MKYKDWGQEQETKILCSCNKSSLATVRYIYIWVAINMK